MKKNLCAKLVSVVVKWTYLFLTQFLIGRDNVLNFVGFQKQIQTR